MNLLLWRWCAIISLCSKYCWKWRKTP